MRTKLIGWQAGSQGKSRVWLEGVSCLWGWAGVANDGEPRLGGSKVLAVLSTLGGQKSQTLAIGRPQTSFRLVLSLVGVWSIGSRMISC